MSHPSPNRPARLLLVDIRRAWTLCATQPTTRPFVFSNKTLATSGIGSKRPAQKVNFAGKEPPRVTAGLIAEIFSSLPSRAKLAGGKPTLVRANQNRGKRNPLFFLFWGFASFLRPVS